MSGNSSDQFFRYAAAQTLVVALLAGVALQAATVGLLERPTAGGNP